MSAQRLYRGCVNAPDLNYFIVSYRESDILIGASSTLKSEALDSLKIHRSKIESYIKKNPVFQDSFVPLAVRKNAPQIVKAMTTASKAAGVGPMAAVAGAIAEFVGRDILKLTQEIIVENGGDIFIKSARERIVGVYAGNSKYTGKIGIKIYSEELPCAVCTSSGKVGHSFSFGEADAVVVIAESGAIADAFATAIANTIHSESDVKKSVDLARETPLIKGLVVILGEKMGIAKEIEIVKI